MTDATLAKATPRIDHPQELDRMVRQIVERVDPVAIYLFGSRARGDADPESDYDLMIVLPDDFPADKINASTGFALVEGRRIAMDVGMSRAEAFASRRRKVGTLEYKVGREGVAIYERGHRS